MPFLSALEAVYIVFYFLLLTLYRLLPLLLLCWKFVGVQKAVNATYTHAFAIHNCGHSSFDESNGQEVQFTPDYNSLYCYTLLGSTSSSFVKSTRLFSPEYASRLRRYSTPRMSSTEVWTSWLPLIS